VLSLTTFVRGELGLRSMLVNSQASFGGLSGVLREAELSDFVDMHGYWSESERSQVTNADLGSLGRLASYRVFGKPFVVSEFASAKYEGSSRYPAEMFPLMIGIAGLQDWDALFAFAYADQKREYDPTHANGAFDLAGHPVKLAFLSTAAAAFRAGLVAPATSRVELDVPEQPSELPYGEDALPSLWGNHGVPLSLAAVRQLGITLRPGSGTPPSLASPAQTGYWAATRASYCGSQKATMPGSASTVRRWQPCVASWPTASSSSATRASNFRLLRPSSRAPASSRSMAAQSEARADCSSPSRASRGTRLARGLTRRWRSPPFNRCQSP
jgi:hypothetical protein